MWLSVVFFDFLRQFQCFSGFSSIFHAFQRHSWASQFRFKATSALPSFSCFSEAFWDIPALALDLGDTKPKRAFTARHSRVPPSHLFCASHITNERKSDGVTIICIHRTHILRIFHCLLLLVAFYDDNFSLVPTPHLFARLFVHGANLV